MVGVKKFGGTSGPPHPPAFPFRPASKRVGTHGTGWALPQTPALVSIPLLGSDVNLESATVLTRKTSMSCTSALAFVRTVESRVGFSRTSSHRNDLVRFDGSQHDQWAQIANV